MRLRDTEEVLKSIYLISSSSILIRSVLDTEISVLSFTSDDRNVSPTMVTTSQPFQERQITCEARNKCDFYEKSKVKGPTKLAACCSSIEILLHQFYFMTQVQEALSIRKPTLTQGEVYIKGDRISK